MAPPFYGIMAGVVVPACPDIYSSCQACKAPNQLTAFNSLQLTTSRQQPDHGDVSMYIVTSSEAPNDAHLCSNTNSNIDNSQRMHMPLYMFVWAVYNQHMETAAHAYCSSGACTGLTQEVASPDRAIPVVHNQGFARVAQIKQIQGTVQLPTTGLHEI